MGNDGGSIPTRRELVKEAARNQTTAERKESQQEQQEYCWTTDPISRKPLAQPVVSDCNGKLYNKDVILEFLVEGSRKEDVEAVTQGSIKSLKDIVEVRFDVDAEAPANTNGENKRETWECPITGDRLGPGSKAVYLVPCGHAFSGSAIKEVSDIARLSLRMKVLKEKGLAHSLKKASGSGKKRKKRDEEVGVPVGSSNTTTETESKDTTVRSSTPLNGTAHENNSSGINNSSTASLAAKVKQEQELTKRRKTESETVRGLFSSRDQSKPIGKSSDFMTRGFSVPTGAKR
ncbi:Replication termination factor 2 [Vermiconidia calcicola]|uniref:Replication termination factor 2 n=1 Tax=Vermiconidia calcicola TaxID=1690605 RepID=A0ACC3MXS9_9PEZI|nr:Replication termination factor 2 [Vermiconidia calcicola]